MKKSSKNKKKKIIVKGKKIKIAKVKKRTQKKVIKSVKNRSSSISAFSRAEDLYSSLSLTQKEEHELLKNFFVSAIEKGINKRGNKSLPLAESIALGSGNEDTQAGLLKADEKIGRVLNRNLNSDSGSDDHSDGEAESKNVSNDKNAQPKYKNVESILKYNESPDDKGGVKLVIMNFND